MSTPPNILLLVVTSWINPDGFILIYIQRVLLLMQDARVFTSFQVTSFFICCPFRWLPAAFPLFHLPPFSLSFYIPTFSPFHLPPFLAFPFALYMSKAIDISPALSHNSLLFILAARKESERDGCLQRLPAYLPTSQSPQIVPFFPACLDLYPDALTSSSVGREIYWRIMLCTKSTTHVHWLSTEGGNVSDEKKYHFTGFNTPSVSESHYRIPMHKGPSPNEFVLNWIRCWKIIDFKIQTVSGVVLTLDCVRVWECALRYHTEQQIQSGQKPEQLQLEESLLTDYRRVSPWFT